MRGARRRFGEGAKRLPASIASLLLTTEAVVCEIPEEKEEAPMGGGMPPGGGMY